MSKSAKVTTNFQPSKMAGLISDSMSVLINDVQRFLQKDMKLSINAKSPPVSRPFNPPNKRTGNLGRSIVTDRVRNFGRNKKIGLVRVDAPYARSLEYGATLPGGQPYFYNAKEGRIVYVKRSKRGTKNYKVTKPGTLQPRPFVEPSVMKTRLRIPSMVSSFLVKVRRSVRPPTSSRRLA